MSATGAGDVAIAGFLAAFLAGKEPEQALDAASAAAALCLQSADTSGKLLPLEEMMSSYRRKAVNYALFDETRPLPPSGKDRVFVAKKRLIPQLNTRR